MKVEVEVEGKVMLKMILILCCRGFEYRLGVWLSDGVQIMGLGGGAVVGIVLGCVLGLLGLVLGLGFWYMCMYMCCGDRGSGMRGEG